MPCICSSEGYEGSHGIIRDTVSGRNVIRNKTGYLFGYPDLDNNFPCYFAFIYNLKPPFKTVH